MLAVVARRAGEDTCRASAQGERITHRLIAKMEPEGRMPLRSENAEGRHLPKWRPSFF